MWKLFFFFGLKGHHLSSDLKINYIFLGPYKSSWLWALCLLSPMEKMALGQIKKSQSEGWGFLYRGPREGPESQVSLRRSTDLGFRPSSRPSFSRIGSTWHLNARTGIVLETFSSGGFLQTPVTSLLSNYEESKKTILEMVSGGLPWRSRD